MDSFLPLQNCFKMCFEIEYILAEIAPYFFCVMKRSEKAANWRAHLHFPEHPACSPTSQECHHTGTGTFLTRVQSVQIATKASVVVSYENFGEL